MVSRAADTGLKPIVANCLDPFSATESFGAASSRSGIPATAIRLGLTHGEPLGRLLHGHDARICARSRAAALAE